MVTSLIEILVGICDLCVVQVVGPRVKGFLVK